jgi:hypothetical protein
MIKLTRLLLILFSVLFFTQFVYASSIKKGTYYTKVNIWYEDPLKIPSTNYHRGATIPFGSKVQINGEAKEKIQFTVDDQPGVTFNLVNVRRHSMVELGELFNDYFSLNDPKAGKDYLQFSQKEKENIENGTLQEGMSREAAVAAYGYPPKHKTPTLKSNLWTYWDSRAIRKLVTFKGEKVSKIEEVNEFEEGRPHITYYIP